MFCSVTAVNGKNNNIQIYKMEAYLMILLIKVINSKVNSFTNENRLSFRITRITKVYLRNLNKMCSCTLNFPIHTRHK